VASLSQGRTAAAQCGLFTHKSVPVIFEPPCIIENLSSETMVGPWRGYYFMLRLIASQTSLYEWSTTKRYNRSIIYFH